QAALDVRPDVPTAFAEALSPAPRAAGQAPATSYAHARQCCGPAPGPREPRLAAPGPVPAPAPAAATSHGRAPLAAMSARAVGLAPAPPHGRAPLPAVSARAVEPAAATSHGRAPPVVVSDATP